MIAALPIRVISEANGREHWARKAARAKLHRSTARVAMNLLNPTFDRVYDRFWLYDDRVKLTVTLTRIAPRVLDSDNLASGFKATRDGIADWLGIDDGSPLLTWRYAQRRGAPKEYSVEVRIE